MLWEYRRGIGQKGEWINACENQCTITDRIIGLCDKGYMLEELDSEWDLWNENVTEYINCKEWERIKEQECSLVAS